MTGTEFLIALFVGSAGFLLNGTTGIAWSFIILGAFVFLVHLVQ
jgi:hypothetical protein